MKDLVSIDLLINAVQSRQTGYSYSFSYIFKNSEMKEVIGWDPSLKARVRIPYKEMLIALKIPSMRLADKRDIIMLCYEKSEVKKIFVHLKGCPKEKIITNIDELLKDLKTQNLKDSLKGIYSLNDKIYERVIENCVFTLGQVKEKL